MKVAATVILYNPDVNCLHNINSYISKIGHLYIYDNSALATIEIFDWAIGQPHVSYFHSGINEGIAKRLNEAIKRAIEDGYEWLLTMDQDSFFEENEINKYFKCFTKVLDKTITAMIGVNVDEKLDDSFELSSGANVEHLITSGSIVNLEIAKNIGGFDEDLFIDEVDWEYCFRAISKGYSIIKLSNVFMQHKIGEVYYFLSLKTFKKTPRTLHNPLRLYYMVRNYFYVAEKYHKQFKQSAAFRRKTLLNRIKNNLLYSNRRFESIRNIKIGYLDYKKNKKGKYNH